MPAVKNVGEPCAGEPHARFDVAAGGNQASRLRRAAQAPPADPTARHSALDDSRKRSIVIRDTTRLPDPRKATMLRLGSNRGAEHRLGVPLVTIQRVR